MFDLRGYCKLDVSIGENKVALPVTLGNLKHCIIVDNLQFLVPVLDMRFIDSTGVTKKSVTLGDGTPITVAIGKDSGTGTFRRKTFRVISVPESKDDVSGYMYHVIALLDEMKYVRGQVKKAYSDMTSVEAIRQLAKDCGFTDIYTPAETNDRMTWLPAGSSYGNLCHNIADHGWIDDTSCMVTAVSSDFQTSRLMYINLPEELKLPPVAIFSQNPHKSNEHLVVDMKVKNFGGFFNNWVGYGHEDTQETLSGAPQRHKDVKATKTGANLNMDAGVKASVGTARRTFQPIDCGNTSAIFSKAEHQNNRLRATYSQITEVTTPEFTNVKLFDIVALDTFDAITKTKQVETSGNYLVGAKIKMILGNKYYEKFRLVSTGSNANVGGSYVS